MARTITENQYMELRKYEECSTLWISGGPLPSLVTAGYIAPSVRDRSMFGITQFGLDALKAFRCRYGIA